MKIYDIILEGYKVENLDDVKNFCSGLLWSEIGQTENNIKYKRYEDTFFGKIDIYYDFGADYYFFADAEN